jgi:hypothetical protein
MKNLGSVGWMKLVVAGALAITALSGCWRTESKPAQGSLLEAVAKGDERLVIELISKGADVNEGSLVEGSSERITPLMIAVVGENRSMVRTLLLNGASQSPTVLGYSSKDLAMSVDDEDMVQAFDIQVGSP